MSLTTRTATMDDLDEVTRVEAECFLPAEAAPREQFADRLAHYPDCFWLMFDEGELVSFVDGFVSNAPDLTDEMFARAGMHEPDGAWQMIFGVATVPSHRNRGLAGQLVERCLADARARGCKGAVLTCKDALVPYYSKFGFVNEGPCDSTHGGAKWNQMRIVFE